MCRVSARWCSTSCPGASFYCKRKPPRSIGYGRTRRETRRSADESVEDTSRSKTRVGRRHATPATIPTPTSLPSDPRTFDLRQASRNPRATRRRRETRRSVAFVHLGISGQSPMMGGRNRSNRRSFVRVILNSPPRHASFRPRTFPRVSPTTRVALAGDGAGGGCVCRFVMILSSLSSLLPRPFPPPRAPPTHTSDTRVEWDGAGRRDEGRGTRR